MNIFQLFFAGLILITAFVILATAQAKKTPTAPLGKIGSVNTVAFENEKTGIKDLTDGYDKILLELKPKYDELKNLSANLEEIGKEISRYNDLAEKDWTGHTSYYSKAKVKFEEYKKLSCDYRDKADDYKVFFEKRKLEVVSPIINKIADSLKQFAKQNDYIMILDNSQNNLFIKIEKETIDVTNEFIRFYNDYSRKEKVQ